MQSVLVVQRVAGEQRLLLDRDPEAEVWLDQHRRVRHPGLLGALDDLQPRALHQDGIPEDGQHRRPQLLQELIQRAARVHVAPGLALRQAEDLCDLRRKKQRKRECEKPLKRLSQIILRSGWLQEGKENMADKHYSELFISPTSLT